MLTNIQINEILSDVCNFQLVVFGIAVTLFTLLYSFIMNKRELLKNYNEDIKLGNASPVIYQKTNFSIIYINRLKKTNIHLIILCTTSFISYLFSWFSLRFIDCSIIKQKSFYIISSLSIMTIIYIIFILSFILFKEYIKSTKI